MSFDRCHTRAVGAEKGPTQPGCQGGLPGGKALRTESCLEISQGERGKPGRGNRTAQVKGGGGAGRWERSSVNSML